MRSDSPMRLWRYTNYLLTYLLACYLLPGRRSLHSTGANRLLVPPIKRSTVGSRVFPIAGPKTWNVPPEDVTSSTV